ncbi:beclin 1-associated autophagy-related key regulator [Chironomus tepperi]|uniref:beclin 1-associated autophagy-related key regulator n=1 Tax=Chironomus tepperi TaxID=113505 RepID=UPI00391FC0AE
MSNNEEQSPPERFQIEIESKPVNKNSNTYLCTLCMNHKFKIICSRCLSLGLFAYRNSEERFVDKQQKLKNLKNAQLLLNNQFMKQFQVLKKLENLRNGILKTRKQNVLLVNLIKEKKESIQKLQEVKKENHEKNRSMKIILPKYEDKVNKLGEYVMVAVEKNEELRKKSQEQMEQLKNLRRINVDKLIEYIFPIKVKVSKNSFQHEIDKDANAILPSNDESLGSDYFTKEFVIANGPRIPSNGNYFYEYSKWLVHSKNHSNAAQNDEGTIRLTHKTYSIVAALTFIAQLINSLSFYLDVRLPYKITSDDFVKVNLNEQQFRKKINKLNYIVAYIGYMQNIPKSNIHSSFIIENLRNILHIISDRKESLEEIASGGGDSISLSFNGFTDLKDEHDMSDFDSDDDDTQRDWEIANIPSNIEVLNATMPQPQETAMSSTIMNNISNVAHSLFWNRWNK